MSEVKRGLGGKVEVLLPFWFEGRYPEPTLHLPVSLLEVDEGSRTRRVGDSRCVCPAGGEI